MPTCNICQAPLGEPVYRSGSQVSVTSLGEFHPQQTEVFFCTSCTHLQTREIDNIDAYYDTNYKILIDTEEEDQLYQAADGRTTYRIDHQVQTLLEKIHIPAGARILDYGCAKSATMKKLVQVRPDIMPCLFDVSEMYLPFWRQFVEPDNWATYTPRSEWCGSFDIVTSFFALEHVSQPRQMLRQVAALLKPGSLFYCIVPNCYTNIADFVVIDHINHFSPLSLQQLFRETGFSHITIDDTAHLGAFVITATRADAPVSSQAVALDHSFRDQVQHMANYWQGMAAHIRDFEQMTGKSRRAAIYGSGFYGTFIAAALADPARVICFLDQNRFRQGKRLLDKPILAPAAIPAGIDVIYVGLNPTTAKTTIRQVKALSGGQFDFFFL